MDSDLSPYPAAASRGTIVVADDDESTRTLLVQILTSADFVVHAYENGELACASIRRAPPDLILLDWMMPIMDGPAAVKNLKADRETRGIPIVMLTSQSEMSERVMALDDGVQDFLTKPFDQRELLARIEQQMRWRKLLAVDANTAFSSARLQLYRPDAEIDRVSQDGTKRASFFDRLWGIEPTKDAKPGRA
jgi:two-component system phosphate regulon response regulator PhoB